MQARDSLRVTLQSAIADLQRKIYDTPSPLLTRIHTFTEKHSHDAQKFVFFMLLNISEELKETVYTWEPEENHFKVTRFLCDLQRLVVQFSTNTTQSIHHFNEMCMEAYILA